MNDRAQRPHVFSLDSFDDRTMSVFCKACRQRIQQVEGECPGRKE